MAECISLSNRTWKAASVEWIIISAA